MFQTGEPVPICHQFILFFRIQLKFTQKVIHFSPEVFNNRCFRFGQSVKLINHPVDLVASMADAGFKLLLLIG